MADDAVRRTYPWARPSGLARCGRAAIYTYEGRFAEAIRELAIAERSRLALGANYRDVIASLVENLFLADADPTQILSALPGLDEAPRDKRNYLDSLAAISIGHHMTGTCDASCVDLPSDPLSSAPGEVLTSELVRVKIGALALEHHGARFSRVAWAAVNEAAAIGALGYMRWWLRRYVPHARLVLKEKDGVSLVAQLADADPDGWRSAVVDLLPHVLGKDRIAILDVAARHPNHLTVAQLFRVGGDDVAQVRRRLQVAQAARLFVRTFGGVSIHRGNWTGSQIRIEKRRVRGLLGVLAAHTEFPLTRDAAVEILWPDADADSGVNNLNQTVFQLRRYLDPGYRAGESPEYVISTSEEVRLSETLIRTDLAEILRLPDRLVGLKLASRPKAIDRALDLIHGEFLADLRYEDWASRLQLTVHSEVRRRLLPVASAEGYGVSAELRIRASSALLLLDPFDETAVVALALALSATGKRLAARKLVITYARHARAEFDEDPSPEMTRAAQSIGIPELSSAI